MFGIRFWEKVDSASRVDFPTLGLNSLLKFANRRRLKRIVFEWLRIPTGKFGMAAKPGFWWILNHTTFFFCGLSCVRETLRRRSSFRPWRWRLRCWSSLLKSFGEWWELWRRNFAQVARSIKKYYDKFCELGFSENSFQNSGTAANEVC